MARVLKDARENIWKKFISPPRSTFQSNAARPRSMVEKESTFEDHGGVLISDRRLSGRLYVFYQCAQYE